MRISILALGSNGDVTPCAALGGALARRGHSVRLASHADFDTLAQDNGLDFTPVAPPARQMVASAGIRLDRLVGQFAAMGAMLARGFSAPELRQVDLILNQLPGGLFGWDLAEKAGIPMIALAYLPILPTGAFPAIGWPDLPWKPYRRFTHRLAQVLVWGLFRASVNRWRTRDLGLPGQPRGGQFHTLGSARVPWLAGFSPVLIPPPADWGAHIHVTGYWHPPDEDWRPPEDLLHFLDAGPAPLFIGFGSMTMPDPAHIVRDLLTALGHLGLRAVLHSGWGSLESADLPPQIYPLRYAPYTWLFPRTAGVIIHGGSGAVHCAARSGVPTLVVPFLYDQFGWGKRLHDLGAGPRPLPFRRLNGERLTRRLEELIRQPEYAAGAARLAEAVRLEEGLANAVRLIEEYGGNMALAGPPRETSMPGGTNGAKQP